MSKPRKTPPGRPQQHLITISAGAPPTRGKPGKAEIAGYDSHIHSGDTVRWQVLGPDGPIPRPKLRIEFASNKRVLRLLEGRPPPTARRPPQVVTGTQGVFVTGSSGDRYTYKVWVTIAGKEYVDITCPSIIIQ